MQKAYVDVRELDRPNGERIAKSIARKVVEASERTPASITVASIPGVADRSPDSYDALVRGTDLETPEGLEGTVEASEARVSAAIDLFSPPLMKAVVRDEADEVVFARHEYAAMEFELRDDTFVRLLARLTDEERARIDVPEQN